MRDRGVLLALALAVAWLSSKQRACGGDPSVSAPPSPPKDLLWGAPFDGVTRLRSQSRQRALIVKEREEEEEGKEEEDEDDEAKPLVGARGSSRERGLAVVGPLPKERQVKGVGVLKKPQRTSPAKRGGKAGGRGGALVSRGRRAGAENSTATATDQEQRWGGRCRHAEGCQGWGVFGSSSGDHCPLARGPRALSRGGADARGRSLRWGGSILREAPHGPSQGETLTRSVDDSRPPDDTAWMAAHGAGWPGAPGAPGLMRVCLRVRPGCQARQVRGPRL